MTEQLVDALRRDPDDRVSPRLIEGDKRGGQRPAVARGVDCGLVGLQLGQ